MGNVLLSSYTLYLATAYFTWSSKEIGMKLNSMKIAAFTTAFTLVCTASVLAQDTSSTAAQDKTFVMKAGQGSLAEIQISNMALKKSKNPDVKAFAQKMVDDHTKLIADMKPFADQMGVPPPTKVPADALQEEARLKAKTGDSFDNEYITAMVADHHKDLGEFVTERDTTQNQDLKTTVAQGTQVVKQHTDMIDQMAQAKGISTPPIPSTPGM